MVGGSQRCVHGRFGPTPGVWHRTGVLARKSGPDGAGHFRIAASCRRVTRSRPLARPWGPLPPRQISKTASQVVLVSSTKEVKERGPWCFGRWLVFVGGLACRWLADTVAGSKRRKTLHAPGRFMRCDLVRRLGFAAGRKRPCGFWRDRCSNAGPSGRRPPRQCRQVDARARRTTGGARHVPRKGAGMGRSRWW